MESQTVWETRELTQPQVQQVSDVSYIPLTVRSAENSVKSIEGVNISITAGGSVTLRGLVDARGDLTVNATGNITVAGVQAIESGSVVEYKSMIEAGDDLEFIAGKDLVLGTLQALVAPKIRLDSGVDMTLGGQIGAPLAAAQAGGLTPAALTQAFLRVPGAPSPVSTSAWSNNGTAGDASDDRFGSVSLSGTGTITATAAPKAGGSLPGNAQTLFNAIVNATTVDGFAAAMLAAQAAMDVHFHVSRSSVDIDADSVVEAAAQAVIAYVKPAAGAATVDFATTIATRTVDIDADRNISMSGQFYATTDIDMRAGQATAQDGRITSVAGTRLEVKRAGVTAGTLTLRAGTLNGSLLLTESNFAAGTIDMRAPAGQITQTGVIEGSALFGRADRGMSVNTEFGDVDLELSSAGDITISNTGDLRLTNVRAKDGGITVRNYGPVTATRVQSLGSSDRNDITITTWRTATGAYAGNGDLSIGEMGTPDSMGIINRGDVTLNIQGQVRRVSPTSPAILADELAITADSRAISLAESMSELSSSAAGSGVTLTVSMPVSTSVNYTFTLDGQTVQSGAGHTSWAALSAALKSAIEGLTDVAGNALYNARIETATVNSAVAESITITRKAVLLNTQVNSVKIDRTAPVTLCSGRVTGR